MGCLRVRKQLLIILLRMRGVGLRWGLMKMMVWIVKVGMVRSLKVSIPDLGSPSMPSVVKSSKLIMEVSFQRIKSKLHLMNSLDSVALSDEHPLYLIHAFIALASSMANQTTSNTQFMDPFISTLYPSPRTIIHLEHEACSQWHPRVNLNSNSHKSNVPRYLIFPIHFYKNTHNLSHALNQLWMLVF